MIETERLSLHPLEISDVDAFVELHADRSQPVRRSLLPSTGVKTARFVESRWAWRGHGLRAVKGCIASSGPDLHHNELTSEAIRLTRAVHRAVPDDGEVTGLLASMLLTDARRPARIDADGDLVPLAEQDRARWDIAAMGGLATRTTARSSGRNRRCRPPRRRAAHRLRDAAPAASFGPGTCRPLVSVPRQEPRSGPRDAYVKVRAITARSSFPPVDHLSVSALMKETRVSGSRALWPSPK